MPRKAKKQYPGYDERIEMANKKIEGLAKLNAQRKALIEKTEIKLNERKEALAKSEEALQKVTVKRDKLVELKNRPRDPAAKKIAKAEERDQLTKLMAAIKASGKSVDEIMAAIDN